MTPPQDRTIGVDVAIRTAAALGCSYVMLPRGEFALVDNENAERLNAFFWHKSAKGYAVRFVNKKAIYMHRVVLGRNATRLTDHENLNKLDNRLSNLRSATASQNIANRPCRRDNLSSGLKGVSRSRGRAKFVAKGKVGGRVAYLGSFASSMDAARAYDRWAVEAFGVFSNINGV